MCFHIFDYLNLDALPADDPDKALLKDAYAGMPAGCVYETALRIGKCLQKKGMHNQPAAVLADHRMETVLCCLGILASGNYYIPIAPDIQPQRFEKIRQMTGLRLVMGFGKQDTEWLQVQNEELEYLDVTQARQESLEPGDAQKLQAARRQLAQDAPMYVIFTSGSTGEPKGIVKTQENMMDFLDAYIQEFGFQETDRLGSQAPFYFDASAKDIYLALKLKCSLHILDESWFVRPLQLAQYLRDAQISVIQWVPSALGMLSQFRVFDQVSLPKLRMVLFVGEVFPLRQLRVWMEGVPDAEFINLYGASEMAGICAAFRIRNPEEIGDVVPIGYPLKNCGIYLIDGGRLVKEPGQAGELYVKSRTIAAGYLNDRKQTEKVFTAKPLPELPDGVYYRSGDLARYGSGGELIFVSRRDYQIKHMGHRIELGEIEAAAQAAPQIRHCCCLYEKQKLMLFYEGNCEKADVSSYLKGKLAAYMLPNKMVRLEKWPLNANGKTDRMKLKAIAMQKRGKYRIG